MSADIGLIGLAVMGENLVLNMESRGFTVAVFNRTTSKVDEFINGRGKEKKTDWNSFCAKTLREFEETKKGDDHGESWRSRGSDNSTSYSIP